MKSMSEKLRVRLRNGRPMTTISIRIPEDLIDDLKEIAPLRGFGGYQPLIRSYIGEGMRRDEAALSDLEVRNLIQKLEQYGLDEAAIAEVIAVTLRKSA